jgi:hypothetical protein
MDCNCAAPEGGEHFLLCPQYVPPLTDDELRQVRAILAGKCQEPAGGTDVEPWHGKALHPEPL